VHEAVADQLRKAVAELGKKEREVMRMRFGLDGGEPKTLQEVGDRSSCPGNAVRQIDPARRRNCGGRRACRA